MQSSPKRGSLYTVVFYWTQMQTGQPTTEPLKIENQILAQGLLRRAGFNECEDF